ncbi:acetyl-CoA carboxylase biotin carboxylase subunit [candidate division KSB1 bacterium]|nr:acetyl-CoA carboxylase biotin carboxylase subunit [candidate division KSB1 bacterium]
MFNKILIANRGEIAVRIIKTCQEMDISTVAVYSDVDSTAPHVLFADEAISIGAPEPRESYLNIEKIIEVALENDVDAVHPGYGFLSENHQFARACEKAKITFIGPSIAAMTMLGDKLRSRQIMQSVGIPVIPGMIIKANSENEIITAAEKIGYPVLLKASAGGGGKGMRIVEKPDQLKPALDACQREALAAFGDDTVYVEKYFRQLRHIEFQILADHHGNYVHLFERECSIQRRHQKIIEESPSPLLTDDLRKRMAEAAINVVKTAGYTNAGTVEFLVDQDTNFYFLEVNARLQVEHPVTEFITGIDLVRQQILIANNERLQIKQADIYKRGHAIEARIYAEDPENNFLPSSGKILFVEAPTGPWIRNDSGIRSGLELPIYYDPILAKLIVWGETREIACKRMETALKQYVILGIKTQIPFLRDIVSHAEFKKTAIDTHFIENHFAEWKPGYDHVDLSLMISAIEEDTQRKSFSNSANNKRATPWIQVGRWQI